MLKVGFVILSAVVLAGCVFPLPHNYPDPPFEPGSWQVSLSENPVVGGGCSRGDTTLVEAYPIENVSFLTARNLTCASFEGSRQFHHDEPTSYVVRIDGNFTRLVLQHYRGPFMEMLDGPANVTFPFEAGRTNVFFAGEMGRNAGPTFSLSMDWRPISDPGPT